MIEKANSTYTLSSNTPLQNVKTILKKNTEDTKEKFASNDPSTVKIETNEDAAIKREIKQLKAFEEMVICHEHKHMSAGGGIASAPTYIYTYGPDGRKYVCGGNVSMRIPKAATAEDMIKNLRKVQTAALSPANPSPQDIQTASMARAKEASIQSEYRVKKARERYQKQNEVANEIKKSKLKNLDVLDRMIEGSFENPLAKIKHKIKMSFEMSI